LDILKKITDFRQERGWTEYQLAEKSGLTQSTISSWYRKNMLPSIPSLMKICAAFDISLSYFFLEEAEISVSLTDRQKNIIECIAKLTPGQQELLLAFLKSL
jgi:transcriptional regulator with XRE-family HTH domain